MCARRMVSPWDLALLNRDVGGFRESVNTTSRYANGIGACIGGVRSHHSSLDSMHVPSYAPSYTPAPEAVHTDFGDGVLQKPWIRKEVVEEQQAHENAMLCQYLANVCSEVCDK